MLATVFGAMAWSLDPTVQDIVNRLQPPSFAHPLGTDQFGRDTFARILVGGRWSLAGAVIVAVGVNLLALTWGNFVAAASPDVDAAAGRLIDMLMALPWLVTALALTTVLGYDPEAVRGRYWPANVHPDDLPFVIDAVARATAGKPASSDVPVRAPRATSGATSKRFSAT